MKVTEEYGNIKVQTLLHVTEFAELMKEYAEDNKCTLYDAIYKFGEMYDRGLISIVSANDAKKENDPIFVNTRKDKRFLFPCFMISYPPLTRNCGQLEYIWVHSRARRRGLGTKLVDDCYYNKEKLIVEDIPEETLKFWETFGEVKDDMIRRKIRRLD